MLTHVHALGEEECIGLRFLLVLKPKLHGVDILSGKRDTLIRARPTRRELAECNAYTAERLCKAVYIHRCTGGENESTHKTCVLSESILTLSQTLVCTHTCPNIKG